MNRRSFIAALAAVVVSGKGRSLAPHKPRGRELVDAATPTRPDAGRRLELSDDDYIYLANDATVDGAARVVSVSPRPWVGVRAYLTPAEVMERYG